MFFFVLVVLKRERNQMHPSSLFSYYPTYSILDEIMSYGNYKSINIFIDLKNNMQTVYMEHAIVNIVEMSKKSKYLDSSVFSSLVSFLTFHKMYAMKRGYNVNFYIFFEVGESYYHKAISKQYKVSRKIDNLYGLDRQDRELFYQVLHVNYQLIERALNKVPNVKVIRLENLEADFIPYYLMTRNLILSDSQTVNVVYSNDHDLWQCISKNCYVFSKSATSKVIIGPGSVMKRYLKKENDILDEYLSLAMSVIGDSGDDVQGINGIGTSRFYDLFDDLVELCGNMNEIYDKVERNQELFSESGEVKNKYLRTIIENEKSTNKISNNLKLVSFELISRAFDKPNNTEMIKRREKLKKTLKEDDVCSLDSLKMALSGVGVFLETSALDFLYLP